MCWRWLYARQLASGLRARLWTIADVRLRRFLRWTGLYVDFLGLGQLVASVLLPLALSPLAARCRVVWIEYGTINTQKLAEEAHSRHQTPPQRASVALRCPQSLGHLAEMRQKLTSFPIADSFAVGNRPMTSI